MVKIIYKNKIRADLFISSILFFSFVAILGYFLIFAKSEGGFDNNKVLFFIADYISYLFPLIYLSPYSFASLVILASLNILVYAFVITALLTNKLNNSEKYKPFDLVHFVAYAIPLIFLCIFAIMIFGKL